MKSIIAFALLAACGFPEPANNSTDAGGDAPPDGPPCPSCQLVAIEPSIANTGDTITLEGTFADGATVSFPGGASASAKLLGPHRATAIVPGTATAGALTVTVGSTTVGPVPFRRASFQAGLQSFQQFDDQANGARPMPTLVTPRNAHAVVVVKDFLYAMGGFDPTGTGLTSIERARVGADGSLGAFEAVSAALTVPRSNGAAIVVGNYVYVIGGQSPSALLGSVERSSIQPDGSLGPFAIVPGLALVTTRSSFALNVVGDSLYVIGGDDGSADVPRIERASILPDGTLGSFAQPGVVLGTPRNDLSTVVIGPYLYAVGGFATATGSAISSVERASIAGDGTLGAFVAAPGLVTPRAGSPILALGSSLYVIGGGSPLLTTIEAAPIGVDGLLGAFAIVPANLPTPQGGPALVVGNFVYFVCGSTAASQHSGLVVRASLDASGSLGTFAPDSAVTLVTGRSGATSTVIGSSLYLVGGADASGNLLTSVERATIAPDGSVGAFSTVPASSLVTARQHATSAVVGSSLYVLGGIDPTGHAITSIERATFAADGSLGSFTAAGALATTRGFATSVVAGGFLYVVGGGDACCGLFLNTVERASIAADGSLGAFTNLTGALAARHAGHTTAVIGGFMYVFAGASSAGVYSNIVERAAINSDGSLGTFALSAGGSLVSARQGHTIAVIGGFVYVIGGVDSTGRLDNVERAAITADGTLGAFAVVATSKLATARANGASAVIGNTCYAFGGDTAATSNTVEKALLP